MFALSLRIAQPLARENAIFGGGHLSPLRFAERFQHFKDMIGKLSLSALSATMTKPSGCSDQSEARATKPSQDVRL